MQSGHLVKCGLRDVEVLAVAAVDAPRSWPKLRNVHFVHVARAVAERAFSTDVVSVEARLSCKDAVLFKWPRGLQFATQRCDEVPPKSRMEHCVVPDGLERGVDANKFPLRLAADYSTLLGFSCAVRNSVQVFPQRAGKQPESNTTDAPRCVTCVARCAHFPHAKRGKEVAVDDVSRRNLRDDHDGARANEFE